MIECTQHSRERYVERFMHPGNNADMHRYIESNKILIDERINLMIEYGQLLYTGKLSKNQNYAEFYLKDDNCIIVADNKVVTLYKIKFHFPEATNQIVINALSDEIIMLNKKIADTKREKSEEVDSINIQIEQNLNVLERYKAEIDRCKQKNSALEMTKIDMQKDINVLEKELKVYAHQLFANTETKL